MARQKAVAPEERRTIAVKYRIIPYFAVAIDDDTIFSGIRGVGETPFKALVNMRGEVRRRYPASRYDIEESISNPEFIQGWTMPEPF